MLYAHTTAAVERLLLAESQDRAMAGGDGGVVRLGSFFTALVHLWFEVAAVLGETHDLTVIVNRHDLTLLPLTRTTTVSHIAVVYPPGWQTPGTDAVLSTLRDIGARHLRELDHNAPRARDSTPPRNQ